MPAEHKRRFDGISLVVPFYRNENTVEQVHRGLQDVVESMKVPYEMVYVNDGSRNGTLEKLNRIWEENDRVTVLHFARNFGQRAAWTAGLSEARGGVVVTIDGDGQLDPADIPRLIKRLGQDLDVVGGWRFERHDPLFRKLGSYVANWSIRKLGGIKLKDFGCSLRAYQGAFLDEIDFGPHRLFDKAGALSLTDAVADVPVRHLPPSGSGWTWLDLVRYGADNLITFGDQFFLRVALLAAGSTFLAGIAGVLVLLGLDLRNLAVPLMLLGFSLFGGLVSLVGVAAARAIREARGQNCYLVKRRLARRWTPGDER